MLGITLCEPVTDPFFSLRGIFLTVETLNFSPHGIFTWKFCWFAVKEREHFAALPGVTLRL